MFNLEQEALLCKHLSTMAEIGYGYSRQETINIASDFAYQAVEAQCTASSAADPIPQPDQPNYDQVARSFLEKRGGKLLKNLKVAKIRKTLSKVVSGKAITEENITRNC